MDFRQRFMTTKKLLPSFPQDGGGGSWGVRSDALYFDKSLGG